MQKAVAQSISWATCGKIVSEKVGDFFVCLYFFLFVSAFTNVLIFDFEHYPLSFGDVSFVSAFTRKKESLLYNREVV